MNSKYFKFSFFLYFHICVMHYTFPSSSMCIYSLTYEQSFHLSHYFLEITVKGDFNVSNNIINLTVTLNSEIWNLLAFLGILVNLVNKKLLNWVYRSLSFLVTCRWDANVASQNCIGNSATPQSNSKSRQHDAVSL